MKVFPGTTQSYYLDGFLQKNLEIAKKVIKKDWDMVITIDGSEGSGKSVIAMQMAFFCDPTLTIDRITFTPKEFKEAILKAQPYQAVVYDEAYTGLSSRATMSLVNQTLIKMLAEIRQKNLFVFVVMPCFFDLDKYVALWRSRALIHIYTKNNFERGYFAFYNANRKKDLYIQGKKFYSYFKPKPNFIGRFTNHYPISQEEYRKKKRDSLIGKEKDVEDVEVDKKAEKLICQRVLSLDDTIPHRVKMQIMGVSRTTYFSRLKEFRQKEPNP